MVHKCDKEADLSIIKTEVAVMSQRVKSIEKRLFGNGEKGVISKLEECITYIIGQKSADKERSGIEAWSRKKLLFTISGFVTIFAVVLGFIMKLGYDKLIKVLGG